MPAVREATMGMPAAMASRVTRGMPSVLLGWTKTSAALSREGTSGCMPANFTRSVKSRSLVSFSSGSRSGPSPTMNNWQGQFCCLSWATA